jgi:hypothetical protein
MNFLSCLPIGLLAVSSLSLDDPVADCRKEFGNDAGAHIACLEAAIQALQGGANKEVDTAASQSDLATSTTVTAVAATSAEPIAPEVTSTAVSGLGSEQARENSPSSSAEDQQVTVRIISTSYNSKGLGTFRMQDGQVWRETTSSPQRKRLDPDKQYTARIERGKIGGYRMYVDGVRWMKTVERVE